MTKKKKTGLDLTETTLVDVTVCGVPVRVCRDRNGRPLYAHGLSRDDERLVVLAAKQAIDAYQRNAEAEESKEDKQKAGNASGEARRELGVTHWANEYFELAHAAEPGCSKDRLLQLARSKAAADHDKGKRDLPLKKRDEITEHRARQFLKLQRNAQKSGS